MPTRTKVPSKSVSDPFYSGGNQTCNYTHDDISRIASVNCGSPWSQTFGYDSFGNLTKSGSMSFAPTYSYVTNRMTQIGSSTPTYDANGNVTNDFLHTYTWDAAGRPVAIDTVTVTYDALGRMVEQNRSGVYTEIAYAPSGVKLAVMTGQTLQKGFVPLSGGAVAVYNSSGLAYYRHSDWVGSSRFASTPTRTMYSDGAYGPFGEAYAQTGTTDLSYTGMNQDTVSNLYDFPAREYGTQGRWPSPDPSGSSSASPTDPQTWNRYAYVTNSPLSYVDATGMARTSPTLGGLLEDALMMGFGTASITIDPNSIASVGPSGPPDPSADPGTAQNNYGNCIDDTTGAVVPCTSATDPRALMQCFDDNSTQTACPPTPMSPYDAFFASMSPDDKYIWDLQNQFDKDMTNLISPCQAVDLVTSANAASLGPFGELPPVVMVAQWGVGIGMVIYNPCSN
jgi:RHS repeat-associated protein